MKHYKVFDPVFRCEFRLYIGSLEKFKKEMQKYEGCPEEVASLESANGYTLSVNSAIAIWLPVFSLVDPSSISSLSHELMHAVDFRLLKKCGVCYWENNAEVGAYYLEFLMKSFLEAIRNG